MRASFVTRSFLAVLMASASTLAFAADPAPVASPAPAPVVTPAPAPVAAPAPTPPRPPRPRKRCKSWSN